MWVIKRLFDFYISGSIHVALAALSLLLVTNHSLGISFDFDVAGFAFFGTVSGYNFIKFEYLFRKRKPIRDLVEAIAIFSGIALLAAVWLFFRLKTPTQLAAVALSGLALLYAVPIFSKTRNFRSLGGIKIFLVAICWTGVTVFLPVLNAGIHMTRIVVVQGLQLFLIILSLILIFEIIDFKKDHPALGTVPQRIGVRQTKMLALGLLAPFFLVSFASSPIAVSQLGIHLLLVICTATFAIFAHPERSKYYTAFWVESIPMLWLGLVLLFN